MVRWTFLSAKSNKQCATTPIPVRTGDVCADRMFTAGRRSGWPSLPVRGTVRGIETSKFSHALDVTCRHNVTLWRIESLARFQAQSLWEL
jgi:hypothetical protein